MDTNDFLYKHKSVVEELRPLSKTETSESSSALRNEVFQRIKNLIEFDHIYLNPILKLSDIARLANTNRSYASAYFSSEVNSTFYDYINQLRINHAIQLLADKTKRLDEIAEESGFSSRQSFHRIFLNYQGVTPSAFRAKL